jgi:hypothetical protein
MRTTSTLVLAALLLMAPCIGTADQAMMDKISAAKTPADHEALAAEYAKQAADAKAKAVEHEQMAKTYAGAVREKLHFDQHCHALAAYYRSIAKEFDAMAEAHRKLAKQAGK